jgi:hypothetical protein
VLSTNPSYTAAKFSTTAATEILFDVIASGANSGVGACQGNPRNIAFPIRAGEVIYAAFSGQGYLTVFLGEMPAETDV